MNEPTFVAALTSWSWPPLVVGGLLLGGIWYAIGLRRRWRARGVQTALPRWRIVCYYAGLILLGLSLMSPIDTLGGVFFFVHMIQHQLIQLAVPPLLLLGRPILPMLWALHPSRRQVVARWLRPASLTNRIGGFLTKPVVALLLFSAATWFWHIPPLYNATLRSNLIHDLEHAMFFFTSIAFWWPAIHPSGGRRRLSVLLTIPYFAAAGIQMIPLGAILTLADNPLYSYYESLPEIWGISTLTDQQIGGLIMWVGGGFVILGVISAAFFIFASSEQQKQQKRRPQRAGSRT